MGGVSSYTVLFAILLLVLSVVVCCACCLVGLVCCIWFVCLDCVANLLLYWLILFVGCFIWVCFTCWFGFLVNCWFGFEQLWLLVRLFLFDGCMYGLVFIILLVACT